MKLPITLPYYDYFNLTGTMLLSNSDLCINVDGYGAVTCFNRHSSNISLQQLGDITIISIEVRPISFSIGDTVMIVDTGEIGFVGSIEDEYISIYSSLDKNKYGDFQLHLMIDQTPFSNLVKIPSNLLHKLQD